MKRILILFTLLLTACANQEPRHAASQVEIKAAHQRYWKCLVPYARQYDDHVSDANTVAKAIAGACQEEFNYFAALIVQGDNDRVRYEIKRYYPEQRQGHALGVVLETRKSDTKTEIDKDEKAVKAALENDRIFKAGLDAFIDCAARYASAIDDGISSATDVAMVIENRCSSTLDEMVADIPKDRQQNFIDKTKLDFLPGVTELVLNVRIRNKTKQKATPPVPEPTKRSGLSNI